MHAVFVKYFGNCGLVSDKEQLKKIQNAHIVAVGGDGTFHVLINNADLNTNTFSLIAAGSGNDFITAFKKCSLVDLCAKIKNDEFSHIDLIKAGNIYAHTVTGVGFEALVSQKANESKNIFPALKFIIPVARYMFFFKPIEVQITGKDYFYHGPAFMVSMGNGVRAGGGFKLFPKAKLDDGLLDVLIIKNPTFVQKIMYVWLVNFGKHLNLKIVDYLQLDSVRIQLNRSTLLNADGDVYETESYQIEVKKGILRIIQ